MIVPIPGTTQMTHMLQNIAAAAVQFTPSELTEVSDVVTTVEIRGDRLPDPLIEEGMTRMDVTTQKPRLKLKLNERPMSILAFAVFPPES